MKLPYADESEVHENLNDKKEIKSENSSNKEFKLF
jgi:hypothetical protein